MGAHSLLIQPQQPHFHVVRARIRGGVAASPGAPAVLAAASRCSNDVGGHILLSQRQ